jgi:hypothetical protein
MNDLHLTLANDKIDRLIKAAERRHLIAVHRRARR